MNQKNPQDQHAGLLAEAQAQHVWGTVSYHLKDGIVTHSVLHQTFRPSSIPHLASLIQKSHAELLNQNGNYELVFARMRDNTLTLIAVETHTISAPMNGDNAKKKEV